MATKIVENLSPFMLDGASVEPAALRITSAAGSCIVEPKVMTLLSTLAKRPGDLWIRDDLLDRLWPDGFGSDESLTRVIYVLRKALKDTHGLNRIVVTVPKLGYRLDAKIVRESTTPDTRAQHTNLPAPPKRSVAVLPFEDLSSESNRRHLADGMIRDLTSLLSLVPSLEVAAYSSATWSGISKLEPTAVASALNTRYLVSGTCNSVGDAVRLRVDLTDCGANVQIWSKRYEAKLDAFHELQDDVITAISTSINSEIAVHEVKVILDRPDFNLSAYEYIQAAEEVRRNYNRQSARKTVDYLHRALEIDPDNALIHASLAVQLAQNVTSAWVENPVITMSDAGKHIALAQEKTPNHPDILLATGIYVTFTTNYEDGLHHLESAYELDPSNPHTLAMLGLHNCISRKDPTGITMIEQAESNAPRHPRFALWAHYRGLGHVVLGSYQAGVDAYQDSIVRNPSYFGCYTNMAFALHALGKTRKAKAAMRMGIERQPKLTFQAFQAATEQSASASSASPEFKQLAATLYSVWPDDI
ncbi:hypothetical protein A8B75_00765 [Sphingomonadales bacterium EhC05]|nr:hypothetical protein A8B75_00765 [Sphingomonadales bacterium EhC05]